MAEESWRQQHPNLVPDLVSINVFIAERFLVVKYFQIYDSSSREERPRGGQFSYQYETEGSSFTLVQPKLVEPELLLGTIKADSGPLEVRHSDVIKTPLKASTAQGLFLVFPCVFTAQGWLPCKKYSCGGIFSQK